MVTLINVEFAVKPSSTKGFSFGKNVFSGGGVITARGNFTFQNGLQGLRNTHLQTGLLSGFYMYSDL